MNTGRKNENAESVPSRPGQQGTKRDESSLELVRPSLTSTPKLSTAEELNEGDQDQMNAPRRELLGATAEREMCAVQMDEPDPATAFAPLQVTKPRAGELLPMAATPRPRRPSLKTLPEVRREIARVYRDMRHGRIEMQDGTRLTYVLTQVAKVIQVAELDARVEAVERALRMRTP